MRHLLIIFLLGVGLVGCTAQQLEVAQHPKLQTIGVYTAVPSEFDITKRPFFALGKEALQEKQYDIADWQMNAALTREVIRNLEPEFTIVDLGPAPAPMFDVVFSGNDRVFSLGLRSNQSEPVQKLQEILREVNPVQPVDAYMAIVARRTLENRNGIAQVEMVGWGAYQMGSIPKAKTAIYAAYEILLFDAETLEVMAKGNGHVPTKQLNAFSEYSDAREGVAYNTKNTYWDDDLMKLSDESKAAMHFDLNHLLELGVEFSLGQMKLIDLEIDWANPE